jgi:hypothetical protein
MKFSSCIAIFFIAACAVSTGAMAQKTVYRCGASYSQIPCEGAVAVNADDARTKADKADADKATKRDMKQATEMEKARIKEDKEALAQGKAATKANAKAADKLTSKDKPKEQADDEDKKKPKHKKKEPEFFTAKAAPDKKP